MVDTASDDDDDRDLPSRFPGTLIAGKYRIDTMIGRGGMGSVWSAMHMGLGQRVAVKLIARRYANSREARQRFDLEAKAVAQLRSRFVVQVYDNGETEDGTPYIVMEMLDGESLDQRINRRGPVPVEDALRILAQVARALTRAHALGIVHRDLKPENIFLARTEDDDGEIAKVLDFGIAKIKTPESTDSATRTGAVLGTPLFMSPEQARGLKSVDHRTDLYSLGMVAYQMLTGQSAFSGESFGDILVAICTQPLPEIHRVASWLPPGLDTWLQKACARDPGDRYQSTEDLVDGLYAAVGVPRPNLRSKELVRSGSSGIGAGSQGADGGPRVASAQTGQGLSQHRTTSAVAVTPDDIPKRSMLVPLLVGAAAVAILGGGALFALWSHRAVPAGELGAATIQAAAPALPSTGAPSTLSMHEDPKPEPSAALSTVPVSSVARPVVPKPTGSAKPAAKVPDAPKAPAKNLDARPAAAKPKPAPDLGF